MLKRILCVLTLLMATPSMAGVELFDQSGGRVFTDLSSLNQSLSALNAAVTLTLTGQAKASIQVTGTWTGTLSFEGTVDNTNWFAVNGVPPATGVPVASTTVNGQWQSDVSALTGFRVRMSAGPTGAAITSVLASQGSHSMSRIGITGNAFAAIDAAQNSTPPANVVSVGYEAATQTTTQPTAATAGNVRRPVTSGDGALYVRQGGPVMWNSALTAIGATLTEIRAAPGAGLKLYVTDITVMSDTATGGQFLLRYGTGANCGTGTTTLFPAVAALTTGKLPYPGNASSALTREFVTPISNIVANNAICVICIATNTCTIQLNGYTAP